MHYYLKLFLSTFCHLQLAPVLIHFNCMEQPGYSTKNLLLYSMDERKSKRFGMTELSLKRRLKPSISPLYYVKHMDKQLPRFSLFLSIAVFILSLHGLSNWKPMRWQNYHFQPRRWPHGSLTASSRRKHLTDELTHPNGQCTCQSHTLSTQQTQPHSVLNTPGQSKKSDNNINTFWSSSSFFNFSFPFTVKKALP